MKDGQTRDLCAHSNRLAAAVFTVTGGLGVGGIGYIYVMEWAENSWLDAVCGLGAICLFLLLGGYGFRWLVTSVCVTDQGLRIHRLGYEWGVLSPEELCQCTIHRYQPSTNPEGKPMEDGHLSFRLKLASVGSISMAFVPLSRGLPFLRELERLGVEIVLDDSRAMNFRDELLLYDYVDPTIKGVEPSDGA